MAGNTVIETTARVSVTLCPFMVPNAITAVVKAVEGYVATLNGEEVLIDFVDESTERVHYYRWDAATRGISGPELTLPIEAIQSMDVA